MEAPRKNHCTFYSMMHPEPSEAGVSPQDSSRKRINVQIGRIQEELMIYEWRRQHSTDLISYEWMQIEPYSCNEVTFTLKPMQNVTSLEQIQTVRGSQLLKNIGRIFTSFGKLYQKFGPFQLSADMIAFDIFYHPYVWMSSDYLKNEYIRDHISERNFAANLLAILINHGTKFQQGRFVSICLQIKDKGKTIKQMSNHFNDSYNRKCMEKQSKIEECESPEAALCFNKQLRQKKTPGLGNRMKRQSPRKGEIYRSFLEDNQKGSALTLHKAESMKNLNLEQRQSDHSQEPFSAKKLVLNKEKPSMQSTEVPAQQKQKNPRREEFQISFQFDNDDSLTVSKQVVQLQMLNKIKNYLVTSINFEDK